ncbi:hypothetical protein DFH08DRAFT_969176 [Mycena albidolilacea]|uniref:Uncharacterized protein n=1 Tax=Mycena albidolilacea TaxID=1033008 RepID=A0AAD6ZI55_9AGAR|nr:hypothetical protein DFH08DRAFT_969176 [Mycena albidolilacea]
MTISPSWLYPDGALCWMPRPPLQGLPSSFYSDGHRRLLSDPAVLSLPGSLWCTEHHHRRYPVFIVSYLSSAWTLRPVPKRTLPSTVSYPTEAALSFRSHHRRTLFPLCLRPCLPPRPDDATAALAARPPPALSALTAPDLTRMGWALPRSALPALTSLLPPSSAPIPSVRILACSPPSVSTPPPRYRRLYQGPVLPPYIAGPVFRV